MHTCALMLGVLVKSQTYPQRQRENVGDLVLPSTVDQPKTLLSPNVASMNTTQQSGRPLFCSLCCPYILVDTAILPRQFCLLHPGPGAHLHLTQFFQSQLLTPSQVQKQLELVNRLSANWGLENIVSIPAEQGHGTAEGRGKREKLT